MPVYFLLIALLYSMKPLLKKILDTLPFDGWKSLIGVVGMALVLGFQQMGYLDATATKYAMDLLTLWTGAAVVHKTLKEDPSL